MNARHARTCALAALLVAASAAYAHAGSIPAVSTPADAGTLSLEPAAVPTLMLATAPEASLELTHLTVPDEQMLGVHYRPRNGRWGNRVDAQSVSQIHLGFYDPEGQPGREFLLGIRGGPMLDPHVQLGVGLDWSHIVDNASSVTHETPGPNGTTLTVRQDLSRASTNVFPIMAFAQFSGDDNMSLVPYFGVSGGYEVVNLSADNFQTNQSFDATYGGWGWQVWGGAAIPLSGQVRVGAEVFLNTAEPGRDVTDNLGVTYRETVRANGSGLRIGMAWGF
jgi:hypothetical protein